MQKSRVIVLDHFPAVEHKKNDTKAFMKYEREMQTHTHRHTHTHGERYTHNIYTHTKTQIHT